LADVSGASIFMLSDKEARTLVDLLNHKKIGTTCTLDGDIERSTVEEVLNVLANSYMSVLGELNAGAFSGSVPELIHLNELDKFLVKFLKSKELPRPQQTVVFKTALSIAKHKIVADLSFLFREEILQRH
jgi:chemotaxis protein CheY-P-specific phosphatase CheC